MITNKLRSGSVRSGPKSSPTTIEGEVFTRQVRLHAHRYFPHASAGKLDVRLVSERLRPQSALYRIEVADGARSRFVLVKVPSSRGPGMPEADARPRLVPVPDLETKFRHEYAALSAIHNHFTGLGDSRFGAIRVLDCLPDQRAVIMEETQATSLRSLVAQTDRLRAPLLGTDLDAPFRNAGAWLREYHSLPNQEHVAACNTTRDDFIGALKRFTEYLQRMLGNVAFFEQVESAATAAVTALPAHLPLGLRHGDYAPRNILVASGGRVTVIDTLSLWWAPIYEDIAYFLIALTMSWPQIVSQGLAFPNQSLARYEQAFLAGYFGEQSIPRRIIRLYEILTLLDKWSSMASPADRQMAGSTGPTRGWQLALRNRYFRKRTGYLLARAEQED